MEANALIGDVAEDDNQKKRIRHRHKKIYEDIKKQMEFYFSDANLSKDRFLSELIQKNPEVDVAIFLNFNKIRQLTNNTKNIKKALKRSELLTVTEDGNKVFRSKPIMIKKNEEECTIYVEKLPLEANHEWLRQVFSKFGTVDYVSIPKYRNSEKIKGFAFIEFHTPEEANKTLEAFGAAGCCLTSNMEPENLCSVITHEKDDGNDQLQQLDQVTNMAEAVKNDGQQGEPGKEGEIRQMELEKHDVDTEKPKKIKKKDRPEHESTEKVCSATDGKKEKIKSKNTDNLDEIGDEEDDPSAKAEKKVKKKRKHTDDDAKVEEGEDLVGKAEKKKKLKNTEAKITTDQEEAPSLSKKEKKANKKRKHSEVGVEEEDVVEDIENKQTEEIDAENVSETVKPSKRKRQVTMDTPCIDEDGGVPVKKVRTESDGEEEQETEAETSAVEGEVHKNKKSRRKKKKKRKQGSQDVSSLGLQVLSKTEWRRLRNKYLNLQKLTMKNLKHQLSRTRKWDARGSHTNGHSQNNTHIDNAQPDSKLSFTPGVIVRVGLDIPLLDTKVFKAEAKSLVGVDYVDIKEGAREAFLRCNTSEAAKKLVSIKHWQEMAVLEGDEDKQYWERILLMRSNLLNKRKDKKRGRDKLLARAEKALGKHIKFDEAV